MKAKAVFYKFIKSDPTKNDINTNWCTIKSILNNLLNDYVPYRTTKSRHNLLWITNEIKRSMRKRDRLFHRARKSNSNIDWANFRKFRNSVAKSIISSHRNYINFFIVENPKCFWSYVKLKRTDNIGVPTIKTGTKVCNSDIDKAEALNNHFCVFCIPYRKITLSDGVSPFESIPSLSIDACGVLSQLRQLNPNKAQGPDELSPQLLKLAAEELAPALTIIFQQSYDLSSTPKDWNKDCHRSTAPSYVTYMLHKKPLHTRNTRSSSYTMPLLNRPAHSKATLGDRSFFFASSSVWNSIPNDVRCAPSLSSFKSRLKTYLFRSVYKD